MIKRLLSWFRNASLNRKIMILVLAVGVIPLGVAFMVSLMMLEKTAQEQQSYTVNQGYTQVFQAVEDTLDRVRNISTLADFKSGMEAVLYCSIWMRVM